MVHKNRPANPRGRPRVGDVRIETVIPQRVMDELLKHERAGRGYRTRVAANVLCEWAGVNVSDGHSLRM
jgi:hypothetical protein